MRESDVEYYFCREVEIRHGEVRKVKWIARAHAPDRLALLPTRHLHFYAELKRPGKGARAGQEREHARMRGAGMQVYVLNTKTQIDTLFSHIDAWGKLP